VLVRHVLYQLS